MPATTKKPIKIVPNTIKTIPKVPLSPISKSKSFQEKLNDIQNNIDINIDDIPEDLLDIWDELQEDITPKLISKNYKLWLTIFTPFILPGIINGMSGKPAVPQPVVTVQEPAPDPKQIVNFAQKYFAEHGLELCKSLTKTDLNSMKQDLINNWGKGPNEFSKSFQDSYPVSKSRLENIYRSERHLAEYNGVLERAKIADHKYKQWRAVGDERSCDLCMSHDMETVPINEPFSNGEMTATGHPNCRCSMVTYSEDDYDDMSDEEMSQDSAYLNDVYDYIKLNSNVCGDQLHGTIIPIEEEFTAVMEHKNGSEEISVNGPPAHPNCRCVLTTLDEEDYNEIKEDSAYLDDVGEFIKLNYKCKTGTVDNSNKCNPEDNNNSKPISITNIPKTDNKPIKLEDSKAFKHFMGMTFRNEPGKFIGQNNEDLGLHELATEVGYDKLPIKVSSSELDEVIKSGGIELFRGVSDSLHKEEFINGNYFAGRGNHGNGIYTEIGNSGVANVYASNGKTGSIIRMALDNNANVVNESDLVDQLKSYTKEFETKWINDHPGIESSSNAEFLIGKLWFQDLGKFAILKGYDAMYIPEEKYMLVLNRSKLYVEEDSKHRQDSAYLADAFETIKLNYNCPDDEKIGSGPGSCSGGNTSNLDKVSTLKNKIRELEKSVSEGKSTFDEAYEQYKSIQKELDLELEKEKLRNPDNAKITNDIVTDPEPITPYKALSDYQNYAYTAINDYLRKTNYVKQNPQQTKNIQNMIKTIDSEMENNPLKSDKLVFRADSAGISSDAFEKTGLTNIFKDTFGKESLTLEDFIKNHKLIDKIREKLVGYEYTEKAYLSTGSDKENTMNRFLAPSRDISKYGVTGLINLIVPKGTPAIRIADYTGLEDELGGKIDEYLIGRDQTIVIDQVYIRPADDDRLYLEYNAHIKTNEQKQNSEYLEDVTDFIKLNYKCKAGTVDDSNKCNTENNSSESKNSSTITLPGLPDNMKLDKNSFGQIHEAIQRNVFNFNVTKIDENNYFLNVSPKNIPENWITHNDDNDRNINKHFDPEFFEIKPLFEGSKITKMARKKDFVDSLEGKEDGHLFRGMSYDEYENIQKSGYIQSKGGYNFDNQEGLTYFSLDKGQASYYASGFAPWQYKPTPDKPAVMVTIKEPSKDRQETDLASGSDEVGVRGKVPSSDIVDVYFGYPVAFEDGYLEIRKENGIVVNGSAIQYDPKIRWEKQQKQDSSYLADAFETIKLNYKCPKGTVDDTNACELEQNTPKESTPQKNIATSIDTSEPSESVDNALQDYEKSILSKLTPEESKFIDGWPAHYTSVNDALFDKREHPSHMTELQHEIRIPVMDNIMKQSVLNSDIVVYRGMDEKKLDSLLEKFEPGTEFTYPGFMSTSTSKKWSRNFFADEGGTFRIEVPKGTNAIYIHKHQVNSRVITERELILNRDLTFRVKSITEEPGMHHPLKIINIEVVQ